ncbi:hypothetical protein KH172YL63_06680 [Bacillus sp. KH172YL63]|nr:hypothetical protein KH172YL63_06680 [Bacillus sp. KH172YL63]
MIGTTGAIVYFIIPLLVIAGIIGITISYFRRKADRKKNF